MLPGDAKAYVRGLTAFREAASATGLSVYPSDGAGGREATENRAWEARELIDLIKARAGDPDRRRALPTVHPAAGCCSTMESLTGAAARQSRRPENAASHESAQFMEKAGALGTNISALCREYGIARRPATSGFGDTGSKATMQCRQRFRE